MKINKNFIIVTSIVGLLIILITVSFYIEFNLVILNIIITIVPILLFYLQYVLENVSSAFILWNKIKTYLNNPGIDWQLTCYLEFDDEDIYTLDTFYDNLIDKYDEISIQYRSGNKISFRIELSIYEISYLEDGRIRIYSTSNINYRESREKINLQFDSIIKEIEKTIGKRSTFESYSLRINFKNENPFYGIYLKKISDQEIDSFTIKYSIDDISFLVDKNSIEASGISILSLDKISRDFLVISNN